MTRPPIGRRSICSTTPLLGYLAALLLGCACWSNPISADEPQKFHDPIERQIEGWTVAIDPLVLSDKNKEKGEACLAALRNHLQRVTYIVPKDRVKQLQRLRIWVDWEHKLTNMQYHPSRGWLLANDHDPRLVKHVHIPRAKNLLDPGQWAKHPYVVLHELAHSYHDQVLDFDHAAIKKAYDEMKKEGSYEKVLLYTGRRVKHYGLNNHKEYFAESTEAYFGVNDFYPFVRAELKEHDPRMFKVLESVWGKVK